MLHSLKSWRRKACVAVTSSSDHRAGQKHHYSIDLMKTAQGLYHTLEDTSVWRLKATLHDKSVFAERRKKQTQASEAVGIGCFSTCMPVWWAAVGEADCRCQ